MDDRTSVASGQFSITFDMHRRNKGSSRSSISCLQELDIKGAYVQADEAVDRKFDGAFQVQIACTAEPSDYEHGFLAAYLGYFRDVGQLQPAGSKARLSLAVIWAGDGQSHRQSPERGPTPQACSTCNGGSTLALASGSAVS